MLSETETALITRIQTLFGDTLRRVASCPGALSDRIIHQLLQTTPAVYVAWLGCNAGRTRREMESRWVCYVAVELFNAAQATPAAYPILERLIAGLNGQAFGPTTGLKLSQGQHLYTELGDNQAAALYALHFSGVTPLPADTDLATLDDYARHWQTWKQPEGAPEFAANINVNERVKNDG